MKTWYTQPEESFSSFYYYNEDSLELVRIRLELGGQVTAWDNADTTAIYRRNHVVGFTTVDYSEDACRKFKVRGGKMTDGNRIEIKNKIVPGHFVYDFSTNGKTGHNLGVHRGSRVIDESEARLPPGITRLDLEKLAKICMRKKGTDHLQACIGAQRAWHSQ
jgi:hypothetical protein